MEERDPCCVYFSGGGGHLLVTAAKEEGKTTVDLESREWDYHVRRFMVLSPARRRHESGIFFAPVYFLD